MLTTLDAKKEELNVKGHSPNISVIIPCYNCQDVIHDCVKSLVNNTLVPKEIILVDDCSNDRTSEELEKIFQEYNNLVSVVRTKQNSGPATARNVGAKTAKNDLFFFVDSDTQLEQDALERFVKRIKDYDAVVGVYSETPLNFGFVPLYKAWLYSEMLGNKGVCSYDQFSASCAGILSKVFWEVGGYDEWFRPGVDLENEELGHRIVVNHKMVIDPSIRASHHFPNFNKMMKTFFIRSALWIEMYSVRHQFSNVGGTLSRALSTLAALGTLVFLPIAWMLPNYLLLIPFTLLLWHFWGARRFFQFVRKRQLGLLPVMVLLHFLGSLAISSGVCFGIMRVITRQSVLAKRFSSTRERLLRTIND